MTDPQRPPAAGEATARLAQIAEILDNHQETLDKVVTYLASIQQAGPAGTLPLSVAALAPSPSGPTPADFAWRVLDRTEASDAWAQLISWVGWLVEESDYDLCEALPECWPEHKQLRDELSALYVAWHAAHALRAHEDAPLRWHEALERAAARWGRQEWTRKCRTQRAHQRISHEDRWDKEWRQHAEHTADDDARTRPPRFTAPQAAGGERR